MISFLGSVHQNLESIVAIIQSIDDSDEVHELVGSELEVIVLALQGVQNRLETKAAVISNETDKTSSR